MYDGLDPDCLAYNMKGRSLSEKVEYNAGSSYLLGIDAGGAYGFVEGLRNAPSSKFKIYFNSVLNACGKRGSKLGNALGELALIYYFSEGFSDWIELDRLIGGDGYDVAVPIIFGITTGAQSTSRRRDLRQWRLHRFSPPIRFPAHSSCITELCKYTYLI